MGFVPFTRETHLFFQKATYAKSHPRGFLSRDGPGGVAGACADAEHLQERGEGDRKTEAARF